jgi:hypothetical protein
MFISKHIFPLDKLMIMPEKCDSCGQKFEPEVGFYYGTGYVSYAMSVIMLSVIWLAYGIFLGLSYKDNSIITCLVLSIAILILLQPWLMRLSRVVYLYMSVKYGKGMRWKTEE